MSPRYIYLLSILLILTIVAAAGNFLIYPKYKEILATQRMILEKQQQIQEQQEKFVKLKKLDEDLKNYKEELKIIDDAMPEEVIISHLFHYIQNLVAQNKMVLRDISAELTSNEIGIVQKVFLSFNLEGDYDSIKEFFAKLESSKRLLITENISIAPPREEESVEGTKTIFGIGLSTRGHFIKY